MYKNNFIYFNNSFMIPLENFLKTFVLHLVIFSICQNYKIPLNRHRRNTVRSEAHRARLPTVNYLTRVIIKRMSGRIHVQVFTR